MSRCFMRINILSTKDEECSNLGIELIPVRIDVFYAIESEPEAFFKKIASFTTDGVELPRT